MLIDRNFLSRGLSRIYGNDIEVFVVGERKIEGNLHEFHAIDYDGNREYCVVIEIDKCKSPMDLDPDRIVSERLPSGLLITSNLEAERVSKRIGLVEKFISEHSYSDTAKEILVDLKSLYRNFRGVLNEYISDRLIASEGLLTGVQMETSAHDELTRMEIPKENNSMNVSNSFGIGTKKDRVALNKFGEGIVEYLNQVKNMSMLDIACLSPEEAFVEIMKGTADPDIDTIEDIYENTIGRSKYTWSLAYWKDDEGFYPEYVGSTPGKYTKLGVLVDVLNRDVNRELILYLHMYGENLGSVNSGSVSCHNGIKWTTADLIRWIVQAQEVLLSDNDYSL